jgi:hypothetical protein
MPTTLADLAFPALWTFQRGEEILTVLRELVDDHLVLTLADMCGLRSIPFEDVLTLTMYQTELEQQLVADGWRLVSLAPDLRSGHDRRKTRRGHDRRRH